MREGELQTMIDGLNEVESGLARLDLDALPDEMRARVLSIRARLKRAQSMVDEIRKDAGPAGADTKLPNA